MDNDDSSKITLDQIQPIEFKWDESNMSVGVIAQELGDISISMNDILSGTMTTSIGMTPQSYTVGQSSSSFSFAKDLTANTISTNKHTIDIDELAEMMETLKKRLLILTPNFEMHEKYPMLKELYNEYKAMEKLLGGPDCDIE
jgi:hypothetical protein